MKCPWMPLYVGDYLTKTVHLSAAQSGAYLHLIMHYWTHGGLPDDDEQLCRISKLSEQEWQKYRPLIAAFFEPGWRHERIEKELALAIQRYAKRSDAGRKGGNAKAMLQPGHKQNGSNARPGPLAESWPGSTNHNHQDKRLP